MKNIVITGASGLVATELTHHMLQDAGRFHIYEVSTHPDKLRSRYKGVVGVECLTLEELADIGNAKVEAVIHCAFARSKDAGELAKSMLFTSALLRVVKQMCPGVFVNISSQSVYGQTTPPMWTEQSPPAPDYLYALGKFATEEMTRMALEGTGIRFTNIRLSSICENARFMNVFVKNALAGVPINVQGGGQMCSFVDVRDVAAGLKKVIEQAPSMDTLNNVYNLGSGTTRTIRELAEDTKRIVESEEGMHVEVNITPADIKLEVGMDISLFCKTFNWQPLCSYDEMIRSLVALNKNETGGGKMPFSFELVYKERGILKG